MFCTTDEKRCKLVTRQPTSFVSCTERLEISINHIIIIIIFFFAYETLIALSVRVYVTCEAQDNNDARDLSTSFGTCIYVREIGSSTYIYIDACCDIPSTCAAMLFRFPESNIFIVLETGNLFFSFFFFGMHRNNFFFHSYFCSQFIFRMVHAQCSKMLWTILSMRVSSSPIRILRCRIKIILQ